MVGLIDEKKIDLLLSKVNNYIDSQGSGEGIFPTRIDGFNLHRTFAKVMPVSQVYRPQLCVVLQGSKQILFGENMLDYHALECLVVSMELPASGRIAEATPSLPFIGITLDIDKDDVAEVVAKFDAVSSSCDPVESCAFVVKLDDMFLDCLLRLINLLDRPSSLPILYPSLMKELYCWFLDGAYASEFCKLAIPDSQMQRLTKAIEFLRENFNKKLSIKQLAEVAKMSPSSFRKNFKAATSTTSLQYQKNLRLLEARRLMVSESKSVAEAAYEVGYESPSQFSREYLRTFNINPKRDAMNLKDLHSKYAGRKAR
ncbi:MULTISPECIES: AraC family transcriptional regulator [unclassified Pseudomonas]|uniref:AraC family transcriptional regulator n=1 Tax=unclassified Pseudomonas TaxID=196821 RepID=UPI001645AE49|nr:MULTISPECIES: AraC family transcriptional regulator [unclassified Pseudomonas]MBC3419254.1 AraC family transcriptional regulator [Pseudomonas sp. RW3S2]MBC3465667.1 AraC family transcriptional regulator [Pseudomonas sp. RW10S2]